MSRIITVIPVYNGERYLEETLRSVVKQTIRPTRVIVLDNCSNDNTRKIVEEFTEITCEWKQNESNVGLVNNLNRAFEFASEAEYLHVLLSDDLILPTFYETLLNLLEDCVGLGIAYSAYEVIDDKGKFLTKSSNIKQINIKPISKNHFLSKQSVLQTVLMPAVILKTNYTHAPVQFPDMPQVGDSLFYAMWSIHCTIIVETTEILSQYRRHSASTTNKNLFNLKVWVIDEWKAMQMIHDLITEPPVKHWIRKQKLKCLFAARSKVKINMIRGVNSHYAEQINKTTRKISGITYQLLGGFVVSLREVFQIAIKRIKTY